MEPIKIVACTLSLGAGNGIASMDNMLFQHLDRNRFDLTYCYSDIKRPETVGDLPYHIAVSIKGRFDTLCELFRDADIVQFNGGFDPVACDAAKAALVPSVIEVMHQCERGQRSPNILTSICVSESVRRCQPYPERTTVIHNGIDTDLFAFAEGRANEKIVLLEVAGRNKNVHFHLDELAEDLLAIDPRIEIWLAGVGQTGASRHGGRVKFLGVCNNMPELYAQAHFMVLPSINDAFGLACVEAMSCGCLPVVSNDGGSVEVVRHGEDGWLINPSDKDAFLACIQDVAAREIRGELVEMRCRARKSAKENFSIDSCIKRFEELYTSAVEFNGRRQQVGPDSYKRASAEGLIAETMMNLQAGMELGEVLSLWVEEMDRPLTPVQERLDPVWLALRGRLVEEFRHVAKAGYAPLAAKLLMQLDTLYPIE